MENFRKTILLKIRRKFNTYAYSIIFLLVKYQTQYCYDSYDISICIEEFLQNRLGMLWSPIKKKEKKKR